MSDPSDILALAADFAPATRDDWLAIVSASLKGAPFDKKLVSKTYDGLGIEPLYERAANAAPIAGRAPGSPWQLMVRVDHPDPAVANAQARRDLENGASGLALVFGGAIGAHGYGLEPSRAAISRALEDIHLDAATAIECDAGSATEAAGLLADHVEQRGFSSTSVDIRFALDPLGSAAACGRLPAPWAQAARELAAAASHLSERGFSRQLVAADGRPVHAAGGSEAQELAIALANALAYLRALEGDGIDLHKARDMVFFRLAADADQFLTIAKFRALRRLWARVQEACGLAPTPAFVSAETAWRMMTRREAAVNMLRTTMAAFAAGIGGADAVTVLPFTAALGLPDEHARRIARNTQLILLEESYVAKVADPAAGSGAMEALTTQLCAAAWTLFQELEAAGGAAAALESGLIQHKIAAIRTERAAAIARRRDVLTGTSEFPDLTEVPATVLDVAPVRQREVLGDASFEPLPALRLAEPFERLRDRSDRLLADTGKRPAIFLANLGPLAVFTARASFAKNFFAAGGIAAPDNDGFTDLDAMVAAFSASGASAACLCSSDETYAAQAEDAARRLAAAGARHVYLAGRPGEREASWRQAGVGTFVYTGCDVLATLEDAYARITSQAG
jgi:methylmalonyl-CoA mutase